MNETAGIEKIKPGIVILFSRGCGVGDEMNSTAATATQRTSNKLMPTNTRLVVPPSQSFRRIATANATVAKYVGMPPGNPRGLNVWGGIAASSDGRTLRFSGVDHYDSDIMLVEGIREYFSGLTGRALDVYAASFMLTH